MITVPFFYFHSVYTKKEDVRDIPNMQRKLSAIILIAMTMILGSLQSSVLPDLINLYSSLNIPTPILIQSSPYVFAIFAIVSLISAVYLLSTKPDYSKVDAVANKYKNGEMIKTRELVDHRYQLIPLLFMVLAIGLAVIMIILPTYSLTGK